MIHECSEHTTALDSASIGDNVSVSTSSPADTVEQIGSSSENNLASSSSPPASPVFFHRVQVLSQFYQNQISHLCLLLLLYLLLLQMLIR